jgi:parallel beta-helix repeat protein
MAGDMSAPAKSSHTTHGIALPALLVLLASIALLALGAPPAGAEDIDEDLTVSDETSWADGEWNIGANVTVVDGGVLNVTNATLTFVSHGNSTRGISVEEGGTLVMVNATCQAQDSPFFVRSSGQATFRGCDLGHMYTDVAAEGALMGYEGGIVTKGGSLHLEDVTLASSTVLVTANNTEVTASGLDLTLADYGLFLGWCEGSLFDVAIHNVTSGIIAYRCDITVDGLSSEDIQNTLTSFESEMTIRNVHSRAWDDHVVLSNGTTHLEESTFEWGAVGVLVFMGDGHVARCEFRNTTTAVEFLYAEGSLTDLLVEDCWETSITLNYVGYDVDTPDFVLDNITVRNGVNQGVHVENSANITLSNLTVTNCGDGIDVISSAIAVVDSVLRDSTQCRPQGCSSSASGAGMLLETAWVETRNVSVEGSHGPGVSAYFSVLYANDSRFVDGDSSGILIVYGDLALDGCEVSGNAQWGIESLGYPIDPEELTGTWGNTLADIRLNMTTNVNVVDHSGMWLSHAEVTATSGEVVIGPYTTGFGGSTQTFELPILEHTYGGAERDFNPWTFAAVFGEFSNSTTVDLELGVGEVVIHVPVVRPDLRVEDLSVPGKVGPDETVTLRATVVNSGNHSAGPAFLTFYYRNDAGFQRVIGETRVGPIEAGATADGSVEWSMDLEGEYVIIAHVDVSDEVDEEDEGNNRLERTTEVVEGGGDDTPGLGAMASVAATISAAVLVSVHRGQRRER